MGSLQAILSQIEKSFKNFTEIKKTGCPLSLLLFKIVFEILAEAIKQQMEIKGTQIGEEVKVLFIDNTLLYIRDSRNSTRKFLGTKNKFAMWQDKEPNCNTFSMHLQKDTLKGAMHTIIPNNLEENKISRNKPNQGSERSVQ